MSSNEDALKSSDSRPNTRGRARLVIDGLFIFSDGGYCIYSKKLDKGVGEVVKDMINRIRIASSDGKALIEKMGSYLVGSQSLPSEYTSYHIVLVTKSVIGMSDLATVLNDILQYLKDLLREFVPISDEYEASNRVVKNIWENDKEVDTPNDLCFVPWASRTPVIDPDLILQCIRGEYNPVTITTGDFVVENETGTTPADNVKKNDFITVTVEETRNSKDIFDKEDSRGIIEIISGLPQIFKDAISNQLGKLTGRKFIVTEEILNTKKNAQIIQAFNRHLVELNVSPAAAEAIILNVRKRCKGGEYDSWSGLKTLWKKKATEEIAHILMGNKSVDVLQQCKSAKAQSRIFVMAFIGVNGVGKSTTLSKVAFQLKNAGMKVMLVACDTFRSGAVEQLKRHGDRLDMAVYDQGYGKDPSLIAKYGISKAKEEGYDVVLVDTAGRMQRNEGLMAELQKIIRINEPDLSIFIAESTVGNDGEDQLVKFNAALKNTNNIDPVPPRGIDCMILTKMDIVDKLIGVPLSLTHRSGVPVALIGTGQQYSDLQKFNVDKVAKLLVNDF